MADYTGDGKADVTVYNKNTASAYFGTGNGDGTFAFVCATGTEYTGISNGNGAFAYTYLYWGIGKMLAR